MATFNDWLTEQEGYGLRVERFAEAVKSGDYELLRKWLEAAYEQGRSDMLTSLAEAAKLPNQKA